jgi:hypothetical protein
VRVIAEQRRIEIVRYYARIQRQAPSFYFQQAPFAQRLGLILGEETHAGVVASARRQQQRQSEQYEPAQLHH